MTKYRHPVFTDAHLARLEDIFQAVCADFGCDLVEFNGGGGARPPARHLSPDGGQLSRPANSLKGVSSRRLRQEFPELARHYWRARRLWSGSYFAGSVGGAPLNVLRAYIEQQRRPHDHNSPPA